MFGHHHHARGDSCGRGMRGGRHWGSHWGSHWGGRWSAHRGDHGGRRERSGRPFEQGDLRLLVLDLIAEQPRHGYELIKAIEDAMQGAYSPSPGVIYPTLTLLEETGLVASETEGSKKLYRITDEGRAQLETEVDGVAAAKARMEMARERFGPPPAAEIGRAMQNLGAALALRLGRGPLAPEELRAVVDALDAAARSIERS